MDPKVEKVPSAPSTAKRNRDVFAAIVSFVDDLWDCFGSTKKVTPLSLYHRLVQNIKTGDADAISKAVVGFKTFLTKYELVLLKNDLDSIPKDTVIQYGDSKRICLEIQKYFHQSRKQEDILTTIRQHLLTIGMLIDPTPDKITQLEGVQKEREEAMASMFPGIDTSTKEGQFINDILETARNGMQGVQTNDPMTAMMGVYRSGALQKMMTGMNDGSLNAKNLGRMMKKTLNALIPDDEEDGKTEVAAPSPAVVASTEPATKVEDID